jgi:hypothetical protein
MKPCVKKFVHVIYIMDDIFCNMKYLFYKFVLFKHCCYCFVRWIVYHLSVYMKVNRQHKHHLSCTLHCHRSPYRRITVRRHFTIASLEMPQPSPTMLWTDCISSAFHNSVTGKATTITDDVADGFQSVSILQLRHCKCHNYHRRRCRRIPVRRHFIVASL